MHNEGTLSSAWDEHVRAEFASKDPDKSVATMTMGCYVDLIPLMVGARGRDPVRNFYANHFLSQLLGHRDGHRLADCRAGPSRR
jgi:hypothetical protein